MISFTVFTFIHEFLLSLLAPSLSLCRALFPPFSPLSSSIVTTSLHHCCSLPFLVLSLFFLLHSQSKVPTQDLCFCSLWAVIISWLFLYLHHTRKNMFLSLSLYLHSAWHSPNLPAQRQIAWLNFFFLQPNSILLCTCTTNFLSSHLFLGTWVVSRFGLLYFNEHGSTDFFFLHCVFGLLRFIQRSGITGLYGRSIPSFEEYPYCFQKRLD